MNAPSSPPSSFLKISTWKVWENPIFRRYCRARLRPRGLGISLLITVLIAGFMVAMANSAAVRMPDQAISMFRSALPPMLIFQGLILFVFGTAQVAGGMTAERDEGVIDYQRLIPMSPLGKVLGYLFGLPVREYVMFLTTLPFAAWLFWKGEVKQTAWMQLYAALFTSTLLYHFTGLLTGTVAKNRRWAFLASMGLVFCLYTVIPQLAKFGLVFFKYLTVMPVVEELLPEILPKDAAAGWKTLQHLDPVVKFFNLGFSELVFTIFSQFALIITFTIMLCRKWRRAESHLLGKLWATGFFVWIQVLLLGNAIPLIDPGDLFISRAMNRFTRFRVDWDPQPMEAVVMSGVFGLFTLILLFVLAAIITPTPENQVKGWRRARKQGNTRLPFRSDPATSFWFVIIMAFAGAAGWYLFTEALVESRWYRGHFVDLRLFGYYSVVMLTCGLGFQLLLESWGAKVLILVTIFVGVVPLMLGAVLSTMSDRLHPAAAWLVGISPLSMPLYASGSLLSLAHLPVAIAKAVPLAFYFWLFVGVAINLWLIGQLFSARRAMAREVLSEEVVTSPASAPVEVE